MSTLNKYLIKESLIPFLLSLGVITTVLFLQFLIRAVDRFLGKGLDVWIILEYLYLNLAWIIALSVPMSLLISTVMTYGRMSQDNEVTALKAAGVSVFSIIKPAVLFGGLIGLLLCLFNNFVLPDMNYHARLLAKRMLVNSLRVFAVLCPMSTLQSNLKPQAQSSEQESTVWPSCQRGLTQDFEQWRQHPLPQAQASSRAARRVELDSNGK